MKLIKFKLPAICLIVMFMACSTIKKSPGGNVDIKVNNISWGVISFKGQKLDDSKFPNGLPLIVFDMQDDRINGSDGCNTFMGIASYKGNRIKTGAIATTKMTCPNGTLQDDFYDALASPNLTYRIDEAGILRLYANDAEVMAMKER